ncbi:MAG: hypothetical protein Q3993_04630 [Filifactor alocis]|nr:hypothetical protein [Filifactor alocis]
MQTKVEMMKELKKVRFSVHARLVLADREDREEFVRVLKKLDAVIKEIEELKE